MRRQLDDPGRKLAASRVATRAVFVAVLCVSTPAVGEVAGTPTVLTDQDDPGPLATKACQQYGGSPVPALNGLRPETAPGDAVPSAPRNPRTGPGIDGKGRRALRKALFTISLLCQNPQGNERTIAALYLAITAQGDTDTSRHPASATAGGTAVAEDAADTNLETAAALFIEQRTENEIENNPQEVVVATGNPGQLQWQAFIALRQQVLAGQYATTRESSAASAAGLAEVLQRLRKQYLARGVSSEIRGLEMTQSAWVAYRAAWLRFLAAHRLGMSREALVAALNRERGAQLALLARQ